MAGGLARVALLVLFASAFISTLPAVDARRTTIFTRQSLSSRFGAREDVIDPTTGTTTTTYDYALWAQYILEIMALVLIFAILHFLFIIVYIIWRLIRCCCCKPRKDGFSKGCVRLLRLSPAVMAVGMIIMAIIAVSFTAVLFKGLDGLTANLIKHGRKLVADVRLAANRILAQPRTRGEDFSDVFANADDIFLKLDDIHDQKDEYTSIYRKILYAVAWVPVAIIGVAALLALFSISCGGILRILGVISFLPACVVLVVCAVQIGMWIMLTDVCKEVNPSSSAGDFKDAIGCADGEGDTESTFGALRTTINNAVSGAATEGCRAAAQLCTASYSRCSAVCSSENMVSFPDQTVDGITIRSCVTACSVPLDRSNAELVVALSTEIGNFTSILSENVNPLLECDFVDTITNDLYNDLCKSTTSGLFGVTIMLFFIIAAADATAIVLFYASQRLGKVQVAAAYAYEYEYPESDKGSDDNATKDKTNDDSEYQLSKTSCAGSESGSNAALGSDAAADSNASASSA